MEELKEIKQLIDFILDKERKNYCIMYFCVSRSGDVRYPIIKEIKR